MQAEGADTNLATDPAAALWAHDALVPEQTTDLFDATYADDECIALTFGSWQEALEGMPKVLARIESAYAQWGFEVNWDADKRVSS